MFEEAEDVDIRLATVLGGHDAGRLVPGVRLGNGEVDGQVTLLAPGLEVGSGLGLDLGAITGQQVKGVPFDAEAVRDSQAEVTMNSTRDPRRVLETMSEAAQHQNSTRGSSRSRPRRRKRSSPARRNFGIAGRSPLAD